MGPSATRSMQAVMCIDLSTVKRKLCDCVEGYGWDYAFCNKVEHAYKNFLCLLKKYDRDARIVPTLSVDKMWHYHILDTRKYVADMQKIFGEYLDHNPNFGFGGGRSQSAFKRACEYTYLLYWAEFGEDFIEETTESAIRPAAIEALLTLFIKEAEHFVGILETPDRSNRGAFIDAWNLDVIENKKSALGAPWCATFVYAVGVRALGKVLWPLPCTASVEELVRWTLSNNPDGTVLTHSDVERAKPGDLIAFYNKAEQRHNHMGIITRIHHNAIVTIEGNTRVGNRVEGVYKRTRRVVDDICVLNWVPLLTRKYRLLVDKT